MFSELGTIMAVLRQGLVALFVLLAGPCFALDSGTASGHYAREGARMEFSHAIAFSQDNAEGLLDNGPRVRVLLSDKDVPVSALYGIAFPPVRTMARNGEVRGVLLEFNPADRTTLQVTVLHRPAEADEFAPSISLANSEGLWKRLDASATRIGGEFEPGDAATDLAFTFSAPVFTDPVQADLRGADAQRCEQIRVLVARAEAIGRGDMAAAYALSSRQSAAQLRALPPALMKQGADSTPLMVRSLKAIQRVVVRRETAVALMSDGSWLSLVLEDGAWKAAD
jgi:hypothetical protein